MITPVYRPITRLFWDWYIRRIIRTDFHAVVEWGSPTPPAEASLLLLGNHISWWDGFFIYDLNRRLWQRRFHVMMLEENLRKHAFLRHAGAYSINRDHPKKMLESLRYSSDLLGNVGNAVLLFPQGRIASQQQTPVMNPGAWRVLQEANAPVEVVACINFVDYFSERKPTLFTYLASAPKNALPTAKALEAFFLDHHADARRRQLER